jgi:hypothetical protein
MGTPQEPRGRAMSAIGSHYQKTGVDIVELEDLVHAVISCRLCRCINCYYVMQ